MGTVAALMRLLAVLAIIVGLGAIPAAIAKRKHRSRGLWWVVGMLGFPIALGSILCYRDLELIPDEQKAGSKLKEKIVAAVICLILVSMWIAKIRMAK